MALEKDTLLSKLLHGQIANTLEKAIGNNLYGWGLFLDFSKAFDNVSHEILLNKVEAYGISGLLKTGLKLTRLLSLFAKQLLTDVVFSTYWISPQK